MKNVIILLGLMLVTVFENDFANAEANILGLPDVAVAQLNENGTYGVVCTNGNREQVTDVDIRLGNVCPNDRSSEVTGILSLQRRSDGNFDVVCKDLTKLVASPEDIIAGSICLGQASRPFRVDDGLYERDPYSVSCLIEPKYSEGKLVGLRARLDWSFAEMTCTGRICQGRFQLYPQLYQIKFLDHQTFEMSYGNGRGLARYTSCKGKYEHGYCSNVRH